jgi:hypothetical protein
MNMIAKYDPKTCDNCEHMKLYPELSGKGKPFCWYIMRKKDCPEWTDEPNADCFDY